MRTYLVAQDHVSKSEKKEWAVAKLGKSIERAFRSGDKIMVFTVSCERLGTQCAFLYTPVSSRLQEIVRRLGDVLHFPKSEVAERPEWWGALRALVSEGYAELLLANSGELLGLPMLHKATGRLNLQAVLTEDDPRRHFISQLATSGEQHKLSVQYIDPIPGTKTFFES